MDPAAIESRITPRTKAIMPVHLYGHPVDMDPILDVARRYGLMVVEDAAEALGTRYKDALAGSLGHVAAFSFFGNKTITTGEGGMVVTKDPAIAQQLRLLRGQGMDPQRRYWFPIVGYNYRMTNIEAAIGLAQMENIDRLLAARQNVARWYNDQLQDQDLFRLPQAASWAHHSYWMYTVVLKRGLPIGRDDVMRQLAEAGIETRPAFYPMHVMPVYREPDGSYPVAEYLGANGINLPTHGLLTEEDVAYVAAHLRSVTIGALA
jgi:perosamine synthetase